MNYNELNFPIEGNVQQFVHFADNSGNYALTFASPFCYREPDELREKKAYLLGLFDQFRKAQTPSAIFSYYILSEEKKADSKKTAVKPAEIFDGSGEKLGSIDIRLEQGFIRHYNGLLPNKINDKNGNCIAFCHFLPVEKKKCLFTVSEGFTPSDEELTEDKIHELENQGSIRRIYAYDLVHLETDAKSWFESLFSSSKKSEMINNRISRYAEPENEETAKLFLTALFAYFWTTYIDTPMS